MNYFDKTVLITWWLGFSGSHLAVHYIQSWRNVLLIDNLSDSSLTVLSDIHNLVGEKNIIFDELDIKNYQAVLAYMKNHPSIDLVIHCAHLKSLDESKQDSFSYYTNNINGTINILKAMKEVGIKHFLYHSTAALYDVSKSIPPYHENDTIKPFNAYGTSKYVCEQLINDMSAREWFSSIIIRTSKIVWMHPSWELGKLSIYLKNDLLGSMYWSACWFWKSISLMGSKTSNDGTYETDFIHIMDTVQGTYQAWLWNEKHNTAWSYVFNIGSWQSYSYKTIVWFVEQATGCKIPYEITKSLDSHPLILSIAKAQKLLNRSPQFTIQQAIADWRRYIKRHHLAIQ